MCKIQNIGGLGIGDRSVTSGTLVCESKSVYSNNGCMCKTSCSWGVSDRLRITVAKTPPVPYVNNSCTHDYK